ncbi:hypothetical protein [Bradyrhizobium sp. SZCCHNR3015]|uniref:hypothetical protein n=1 Tax=Bradyrhizobium sp. SZCCHNR3015 TaxID=3057395 RepID=UPI002915F718|nr:hypothetical protein [Bradyrhizobium sp. SZCCHNR3015]
MASGDLATLADALLWLGEDGDDDDIIARLITACSTSIQWWLGYQVLSANYNKTFNGNGSRVMLLPERNVSAVTSLTIDDQPIPRSTSSSMPGFVFDDRTIYLRGAYVFCRGAQNVQAQYTAGFASVPGGIAQATLDWVKITYDNLDTLPGIKSLKAGDSQIEYGGDTFKVGNTTIMMPSIVAAKLQGYRRVTPT